ncbi:MAG: patatin-like phospholipase RssA [Gammaproteobacteria bacterium]|nr:patatin-like phospholipase RssA [Gammaproteobacteria bacterium]MDH5777141.1 patatin-like phospholipase RssA [Gammaproteobacteria bacterium]
MKIGFALGGGAARGWAHIGIIKSLAEHGIKPDIISGTSIGSLVGAAHVLGKLDKLEEWVCSLRRRDVAGMLDFTFGGGMIQGERLMKFLESHLGENPLIEELPIPFAAVATELTSGNEVWLQQGQLLSAIRASIALPGLFTPVCHENRWLVDGALVNPVPVSLCRALGADYVIAVNLDRYMIGKKFRKQKQVNVAQIEDDEASSVHSVKTWLSYIQQRFTNNNQQEDIPGLFDVLSTSVYIMQDRITRSRLVGDPPDLLLAPDLSDIGLMDFDHAQEAIDKGIDCVERHAPTLARINN